MDVKSSDQVRLAIIVAFYNRKAFLLELLSSICEFPVDFIDSNLEVVLVDDGSEREIFEENDIPQKIRKLTRLFRLPHFGRPAKARNFGAGQCKSATHLMFVDSDDRVIAQALVQVLPKLNSKSFDFFPVNFSFISQTGKKIRPYSRFTSLRFPWYDLRPNFWNVFGLRRTLLKKNVVTNPSIIRREVFEQLNGYNENIVVEDYEFWLRVVYHGYRFRYLREPLLEIRVHPEGRSYQKTKEISDVINFLKVPSLAALMGDNHRKMLEIWTAKLKQ